MLRGIFEKIPSLIVKTDVSNSQVTHQFIRPLSNVKRSSSYADGGLGTKTSKLSLSRQEDRHGRKIGNKEDANTKGAATKNVPFYKATTRDSSNNPQYTFHQSRYNLNEDVNESKTHKRYHLEAARPRRSHSELITNELNEFGFIKDEQSLQPRNLKPFHSPDDVEFYPPIKPKRLTFSKKLPVTQNVDEASDDWINVEGKISNKMLMNDFLHSNVDSTEETSDFNAEDLLEFDHRFRYSPSSTFIPRPSYSEYINSKRASIDLNLQSKHFLNPKQEFAAAHRRSYSNFSNRMDVNTSENTPIRTNAKQTIAEDGNELTNTSITNRSGLKRLCIKNGQAVPCYSDYVKAQANDSNDVLHNLNNLENDPIKRESSNAHNLNVSTLLNDEHNSNSYEDSEYPLSRNTLSNHRSKSSSAVSDIFLSKSAGSVSLTPSRTFVLSPAYSDYLKKSSRESIEVEPNKDVKHLLTSKSENCLNVMERRSLSTTNTFAPPTVKAIASLNESLQKRKLSSSETLLSSGRRSENYRSGLPIHENQPLTSSSKKDSNVKQYSSKKKCKPKKDPCEPVKPTKCFLPSKVRLPPYKKCGPKYKPCPIEEKCPPRADDCICVKPKKLPILQPVGCICMEPYIPEKAPALKRLKFVTCDPPRICPQPICSLQHRADDSLVEKPKKLKPHKPKPCDCIEPPPLVDVPLIRLKKVCEPEQVCYPPKPCPPPPPCIRADDFLCVKPKKLPVLTLPFCPCIEETVKEAPPLKRLNLKAPEPPRVCPKPCICDVDCPRADDGLVTKVKPLPKIKPGDCPCVETEIEDVEFKRLKCIEEPEECYYTDPCEVPHPRADFGCWEYYTPEPQPACREVKIKNKKPCKKTKKIKMMR